MVTTRDGQLQPLCNRVRLGAPTVTRLGMALISMRLKSMLRMYSIWTGLRGWSDATTSPAQHGDQGGSPKRPNFSPGNSTEVHADTHTPFTPWPPTTCSAFLVENKNEEVGMASAASVRRKEGEGGDGCALCDPPPPQPSRHSPGTAARPRRSVLRCPPRSPRLGACVRALVFPQPWRPWYLERWRRRCLC